MLRTWMVYYWDVSELYEGMGLYCQLVEAINKEDAESQFEDYLVDKIIEVSAFEDEEGNIIECEKIFYN